MRPPPPSLKQGFVLSRVVGDGCAVEDGNQRFQDGLVVVVELRAGCEEESAVL